MNKFEQAIVPHTGGGISCTDLGTLQVNLGFVCNQRCRHCHVGASPARVEVMDWRVMELVVEAADRAMPALVDLTGGAPELNPNFRRFVETLTAEGHTVQVRTNLTSLMEPGLEDMPVFLMEHGVGLVASMPCYMEENVRNQRGTGVYEKSVGVIKRLNRLGYGVEPRLQLNLVYNPGGAFLPPGQDKLEADYRRELDKRFGISFTRLITIINMPIGRFWSDIKRAHRDSEYLKLLEEAFNPNTLDGLMCRHQVCVGWDGTLYDCDFNLALDIRTDMAAPGHVRDFDPERLRGRRVATGKHCFGCTAGCGSSCMGTLV